MSINEERDLESGARYGIVVDPKGAGFIEESGCYDMPKENEKRYDSDITIVDYDFLWDLCVYDIKDYKDLIYDNKIVFVMYDRIEYNMASSNEYHKKYIIMRQKIRYFYVINLNDHELNSYITKIIGNELIKRVKKADVDYPNFYQRVLSFLNKYDFKSLSLLETYDKYEGYKYAVMKGENLIHWCNSRNDMLYSDNYGNIFYSTERKSLSTDEKVEFNKIAGLSLMELTNYSEIVNRNTLVFIIYDEINYYTDGGYELEPGPANIRFSLSIRPEDFAKYSDEIINEVIANKLVEIPLEKLSESNRQRIKNFISRYSSIDYDNYEKLATKSKKRNN